jgi:hypothetical protein
MIFVSPQKVKVLVEPLWQEPEAPLNNATSRGLRREPRQEPGDCKSRDSP